MSPEASVSWRALVPTLVLCVVLAACSILYELIAAQTLTLLVANTVIWYSLVVGFFLASMGIGALLFQRRSVVVPWRALFRVEIALTLLGSLTVPLIRTAHTTYSALQIHGNVGEGLFWFYSAAAICVCGLGILTGIELPLLMRIARSIRDESRATNLALGWDYLGSLGGALLFALVIVPRMDLLTAALSVAFVNLLVAIWILLWKMGRDARASEAVAGTVALVLIVGGWMNADRIEQYFLQRYFYYNELEPGWQGRFAVRDDLPRIQHTRSAYQVIDVVKDPRPTFKAQLMPAYSDKLNADPEFPVDYKLFLNGDFQLNTRFSEVYHEWFAHVPIQLAGKVPRRVLLLGGGDGILLRELLKYAGIEEVLQIDLDPVLVRLASTDPVFRAINKAAFDDPRMVTVIDDGYQFVRRSKDTFDAVYVDFPDATTYDLARLYSREFYAALRKRIAPQGYAAFDGSRLGQLSWPEQDKPRELLETNDWPIYSATLQKAGFQTIVPFLSTLELTNSAAAALVDSIHFWLGPEEQDRINQIADPVARAAEQSAAQYRHDQWILELQSVSQEQGFIFMTPEKRQTNRTFRDPGIKLHVLNAERFALSFPAALASEAIDESAVNSIVRPTLPTFPWWRPHTGY